VLQLDGKSYRNILLTRQQCVWNPEQRDNFNEVHSSELLDFGIGIFDEKVVAGYLQALGLPLDSKLRVLVVELVGQHFAPQDGRPRQDPLGKFLGDMRILRTSPLTPVTAICPVVSA